MLPVVVVVIIIITICIFMATHNPKRDTEKKEREGDGEGREKCHPLSNGSCRISGQPGAVAAAAAELEPQEALRSMHIRYDSYAYWGTLLFVVCVAVFHQESHRKWSH